MAQSKQTKERSPDKAKPSLPKQHNAILSAIKNRDVLRFWYEGRERIVEPQTYGMSYTGRYVLHGYQTGGESSSGRTKMAKLFDIAKISKLQRTGAKLGHALPSHNPEDSAMMEVFASLPRPKSRA